MGRLLRSVPVILSVISMPCRNMPLAENTICSWQKSIVVVEAFRPHQG